MFDNTSVHTNIKANNIVHRIWTTECKFATLYVYKTEATCVCGYGVLFTCKTQYYINSCVLYLKKKMHMYIYSKALKTRTQTSLFRIVLYTASRRLTLRRCMRRQTVGVFSRGKLHYQYYRRERYFTIVPTQWCSIRLGMFDILSSRPACVPPRWTCNVLISVSTKKENYENFSRNMPSSREPFLSYTQPSPCIMTWPMSD